MSVVCFKTDVHDCLLLTQTVFQKFDMKNNGYRKPTLQLSHNDSRDTCGWWYGNKRASTQTCNKNMINFMFSVPFPLGQDQRDGECVCTRYDFRGLDLHKALIGEGVSEELAHSWLQAEDGLAGGGLWEETHTDTHREITTLSLIYWIYYAIITDVLKNETANICSRHEGQAFICWQGQNVLMKASQSPRYCRPIIMNVNAETQGGVQKQLKLKLGDYGKNPSSKSPSKTATVRPQSMSETVPFDQLTHLKWPQHFLQLSLTCFPLFYIKTDLGPFGDSQFWVNSKVSLFLPPPLLVAASLG